MGKTPLLLLSDDLFDVIVDSAVGETVDYWPYRWELLSSCALASRVFLPRCLQHLYSKIKLPFDLDPGKREQRIRDLHAILHARPVIADYVQELHLCLPRGEASWTYEDSYFVEVMGLLRNVKKLRLEGGPHQEILSMPDIFIQRFFRPYIAPTVKSLHLECLVDAPTQLVTECTQLEELVMIFCSLDAKYPGGTITRPSIRKLDYNSAGMALSELLPKGQSGSSSLVDFSNLRSLKIYTDTLRNLLFEQEVIDASRGALEELRFVVDEWQRDPQFQASVSLRDLPNLHSLEFPIFFRIKVEDSLIDICSTLNTIPDEFQSLKNLCLRLYVGFTCTTTPEHLLESDWGPLASQILRISAGRSLELSLDLTFQDRSDEPDTPSDLGSPNREDLDGRCQKVLEELVQGPLARLKENNQIIVTLSSAVETPHYS
ncbi:hypothetical protein JR316_0008680 [Psilocybe cubensis]|uniref:Uncharacterized protein n=2 Tax=Psilocybe cubensis TaxID=181762 RepID=A0ACB8GS90_PSICU|nr:hypothetical protein JR316_0008680 [Psilocybe cubensis]KAH9478227.1 hypothetical protein JR316_0008680 [Psilocybe cubensis]